MYKSPAHEELHSGIVTQLILAAGADPNGPLSVCSWTAEGLTRMQELALDMYSWIEYTVQYLGAEFNNDNPINRLPPEVLCMIFELAAEGDFVEQLPFAGVCRHWRAVSLDNPTLWSKVSVTANDDDVTSRVALREIALRLGHTRPRPVDVSLHCRRPSEDPFFDPLEDHMSHIRSLQLTLPRVTFQQNFRSSLTMPAPSLASLDLETVRTYTHHEELYRFPRDLFSGAAPKLKKLSLKAVSPPPATWPPLQHLQHFTFVHSTVSIPDLALALRACRTLVSLSVHVESWTASENWSYTAASPPPLLHTPESATLSIPRLSLSDLANLLSFIRYNVPRHFRVTWDGAPTALAWIEDRESLRQTTALHVFLTYQTAAKIDVRVVTQDVDNNSRTTDVKLQRSRSALYLAFRHFFPNIRRLTIGEQLWPTARLPVVPQLEELCIVLEWPTNNDRPQNPDSVLGVFFLPLTAGKEWLLPALRLLEFAYVKPERRIWHRESEPGPTEGPLVISAHNVSIFLTWHILTVQLPVLGLRNVALFEAEDHGDTQQLLQRVQRIDQHREYIPEGLDDEDPDI